jgi:hypothetical protein
MLNYALLSMMTFVEQESKRNYPSFVWGKDICVNVGPDELEVSAVVPVLQEDRAAAPDALQAYRRAISRFGAQKRQGKNSPHIQFANADNDQKLIRFGQQFGPVVVSSLRREERAISPEGPFDFRTSQTVLVARQDLAELRDERQVYHAVLVLMAELQLKKSNIQTIQDCILEIVERVSEWPKQWERERQLRAGGQGYTPQPQWHFGEDNLRHLEMLRYCATRKSSGDPLREALTALKPISAGHYVMCELVNAFSPLVYPWGNTPVEAPHWDLTAGIRPVLYYMLRREYLQAGGIGICRNTECRDLFEIERSGQEFCSDVCSRLQRQREYWRKIGKKLRQRRTKIRKSASARQLGRTSVNKGDLKRPVRN